MNSSLMETNEKLKYLLERARDQWFLAGRTREGIDKAITAATQT